MADLGAVTRCQCRNAYVAPTKANDIVAACRCAPIGGRMSSSFGRRFARTTTFSADAMPDRVEVVYIIVVEGHTKPLEKPFADCWPIGAFVTTEDCDGEHWGPCGLHVIATRRLSAVRFMDKAECRHRLAVLTANYKHVKFGIVSYRRHDPEKEKPA